jgi:hypothetical protein
MAGMRSCSASTGGRAGFVMTAHASSGAIASEGVPPCDRAGCQMPAIANGARPGRWNSYGNDRLPARRHS